MIKNKKIVTIVAVCTVLFGLLAVYLFINKENKISNELASDFDTNIEIDADADLDLETDVAVDKKIEYKRLAVNHEKVKFSFEIPADWHAETRQSIGEDLTIEEMKNFLAGEGCGASIKTDSSKGSLYYDSPWSEIENLNDNDVKKYFNAKYPSIGGVGNDEVSRPFPIVSVSAHCVTYTDWNATQVDFLVQKKSNQYLQYEDVEISTETVGDKKATVITFPLDEDENGNKMATKGGTGGKDYRVDLGNGADELVISKQAKGDVQFEADFAKMIESFRFEK